MTDEEFWDFLEGCWLARGAGERSVDPAFVERLAPRLEDLPDAELVGFTRQFRTLQARAYNWNLWAAAYVAFGSASDDVFMDFRSWLILQGRTVYGTVVADPDSLVELQWRADEEDFAVAEWSSHLPQRIWEQRHGSEMEDADEDFASAEPAGEEFPDDPEWFRIHFPRLSARFGPSR